MFFETKSTSTFTNNLVKATLGMLPKFTTNGYLLSSGIGFRSNKEALGKFLAILKKTSFLKFSSLVDIVVVDNPTRLNRFSCRYLLRSFSWNTQLSIFISSKYYQDLQSISPLFNSANWLEREIWDMFGIFFSKNKDLRRLLTDYGFKGHPLRKDFPLVGFYEIRYLPIQRRVKYVKNSFFQVYRLFNFN